MKAIDEILLRINDLKDIIQEIEEKKVKEMSKPLRARNYRLLLFLDKEQKTYEFGLTQLQWAMFESS